MLDLILCRLLPILHWSLKTLTCVYNLLDRENYSNRYGNLDLPLNFRLTYAHTF